MKINSLGTGTIIFSLGIFFFNVTSGQNLSSHDQSFLTIIFEDISIIISIITVIRIKQNKFEDINKADKWLIILNALGVFSIVFISFFYETTSPLDFSLNNYLIFLGYLLFIVLFLFTSLIVVAKRNETSQKRNKIIEI